MFLFWSIALSFMLLMLPCDCQLSRRIQKRVIGEDEVIEGEGDFAVQLIDKTNRTICTGSIVSMKPNVSFILTAAHCANQTIAVVFSRIIHRITRYETHLKIRQFKKVSILTAHLHPDYIPNTVHRNDIAILKLSQNILLNRFIRPIDLNMNEYDCDEYCNKTVQFYGFGKTFKSDDFHNEFWKKKLQVMRTQVVNSCGEYSSKRLRGLIITNAACKTTFYGDSGGPLVCDGEQIGIASGYTNKSNKYDNYFVKISHHAEFIKQIFAINKIKKY